MLLWVRKMETPVYKKRETKRKGIFGIRTASCSGSYIRTASCSGSYICIASCRGVVIFVLLDAA